MIATLSRRERNEQIWELRQSGMEFKDIGKKFDLSYGVVRDIYLKMKDDKSRIGSYLTSDICIGERIWLHGVETDHLLDTPGEPCPGVEYTVEDIEYDIDKKIIKYHCRSVRGGYREMFTNRDIPGYMAGDGCECGKFSNRNNPDGTTKGKAFEMGGR